ncbi:hypothetical protein A4X06_0g1526 [Tilletia controversa]|uniref:Uncharacterized protein n=1 Tax=Tilletia controversa TaxID=13291 RepID=A0A8X7MZD2_9BASI|nr:hypothetical protein CF328_g1080 [Tilletia controversa]KAE8253343.1 hypothetical protein A4X06_0g1526 [Tilletia controversa]
MDLLSSAYLCIISKCSPRIMTANGLPIPTITLTPPKEPHQPSERLPHQTLGKRQLYVPIKTDDIGWEAGGLFWSGRYAYPTVGIYGGGADNHQIGSYRGGPEGYRLEVYWDEEEQARHCRSSRSFVEPSPQSAQGACASSPEPQLATAPASSVTAADSDVDAPKALSAVDCMLEDDDAQDDFYSSAENDSDDEYSDAYSDSDFGYLSSAPSDLSSFSRRSSNSSVSTAHSDTASELGGAVPNSADEKKPSSQPFSIVDKLQKLALEERAATALSSDTSRGRSWSPKRNLPNHFSTSGRPKQSSTVPKMLRSRSNKSSSSSSSTSSSSSPSHRRRTTTSRPQILRSQRKDAKALSALMPNSLDCAEWLDSASGWEYERRYEAEADDEAAFS